MSQLPSTPAIGDRLGPLVEVVDRGGVDRLAPSGGGVADPQHAEVDDGGGNLFIDDDESIFEADIDKLKTAGVTLGCNPTANTMYCPSSYVTRAQMAAFLHRALGDD